MDTWPTSLPQSFTHDSFSYSAGSGVVRSTMSAGPTKVRKRFTAITKYYSGSTIMTDDELQIFETFFEETLGFGTEEFYFPNPRSLTEYITVRFVVDTDGTAYSVTPDSDTAEFVVSLSLEKLP